MREVRKEPSPVSFPSWLQRKSTRKWILFGVAALVATQLYYVREMLAALLLFSIAFAVIAAVILVFLLLDRGIYRTLAWTAPYTAHAAQWVRRSWVQAEQFGKRQLHRSGQPVEH